MCSWATTGILMMIHDMGCISMVLVYIRCTWVSVKKRSWLRFVSDIGVALLYVHANGSLAIMLISEPGAHTGILGNACNPTLKVIQLQYYRLILLGTLQ